MARAYERAQPVIEDFIEKQSKAGNTLNLDPLNVGESYSEFLESFWNNPDKFWELQIEYWQKGIELWQESTFKFMGEDSKNIIEPNPSDRRFKAKEWQDSALFDFIKQSYLLTCEWMDKSIRSAEDLDDAKREKLAFSTQLFANALSPTNFAMTNPDVIKETMNTGGENLIRGFENLIEDLERGQGSLKISTTDYNAFKLGENIGTSKGSVIFQNDLIQLIQYEPLTEQVNKRPLLVIPPWINKYYILDLREDNSFIKWAVEQGHTVFIVSWVNPDRELAQKRFEDYMKEGIIASLDAIKDTTGEPDCNVVGYCLGGTLLTITLAYLKKHQQEKRIASATFLTTLIDFEHAGDLKLFMDDEQLQLMDRQMAEAGVLQASHLQQTFSLLRANDLIWSFVINNYLMGKEPFPFDLLYWNDDSTNMPAAMHSFYLRKLYRDNLLKEPNGIAMDDTPIDATSIKTPAYFLSAREDHIAPWRATYQGTQLLSGPKEFTLSASGHIAGVVNPPMKNKYCYWTAKDTPADCDAWLETAKEHAGSWWPHWNEWTKQHANGTAPARKIKNPIEAAPGNYVQKKTT
ncbi:MAG: class I poly(R)-hydroxyalkanoic acid synthase [Alphaproteobacteria bacterium]|nr:class I poly(R)-hydroxyalkanoic acid synthase [Alphaproteobacteria bacterium]